MPGPLTRLLAPGSSGRWQLGRPPGAASTSGSVEDRFSSPDRLWEAAFRPTGRFRLPLLLEWSGSDAARWRDAATLSVLLNAYTQVLVEGSVADIVTWVDPVMLAAHVDDVLWPRGYREPWRAALSEWGLLNDPTARTGKSESDLAAGSPAAGPDLARSAG